MFATKALVVAVAMAVSSASAVVVNSNCYNIGYNSGLNDAYNDVCNQAIIDVNTPNPYNGHQFSPITATSRTPSAGIDASCTDSGSSQLFTNGYVAGYNAELANHQAEVYGNCYLKKKGPSTPTNSVKGWTAPVSIS